MAAVRSAARRLGGSLLQRAQAEEGRRLVPSRLIRCRDISTELAGQVKQCKKLLYDALCKAGKIPILTRPRLRHPLHPPAPEDPLRRRRYSLRARGVFQLAAILALLYMGFSFALGTKTKKAVESKVVTKENE